ncbi:thrombospondin type-1 domain-containing protein 1 [Huso huso]|uniref:Thrombospondin type-1 domain-containing protein 1 n=1 Tax=Huso huso TaxID=61971 RepID=A0ABR0ZPC2_HUSHU
MQQTWPGFTPVLLLILCGCALAEILLKKPRHVALSNQSIFVDFQYEINETATGMTVLLVDLLTNERVASKPVPVNQSEGTMEFDCSCFQYAGKFQFRLQPEKDNLSHNDTLWLSEVLLVQWPSFNIDVRRTSNITGNSFQIGISSTEEYFCPFSINSSAIYLEVTYMEYTQVGRSYDDKMKAAIRKQISLLKTQWVELACVFPFREGHFIKVSLRSRHADLEIKSSGRLFLSQVFRYRLHIENQHTFSCEASIVVYLVTPPCASTEGKVIMYPYSSSATGKKNIFVAQEFLTKGNNKTEFNCSLFYPGRNKYCFEFVLNSSRSASGAQSCIVVQRNVATWSQWLRWSPCSVSCGDGVRERYRECQGSSSEKSHCAGIHKETSPCSLEECTAIKTTTLAPLHPQKTQASNIVTVAGISVCLFIIISTIFITVWRKLCRVQKCSSVRHNSVHSPNFRKNSDEVNIYHESQQRESFSESLDVNPDSADDGINMTSGYRRSQHFPLEQTIPISGDPQASVQKIMPPIFGYRLAHQQLKEMKKKGLKEATQMYHVSQNPLNDTVLDATTVPPMDKESQEEANLNRFRIKSPFLEPKVPHSSLQPERVSPKVDFSVPQRNPGLLSHPATARYSSHKYQDDWVEMVDRSYLRNPNFRRTASFHETKQSRPFRERSMSTSTPRQLSVYSSRARVVDQPLERGGVRPKSQLGDARADRCSPWSGNVSPTEASAYYPHAGQPGAGINKHDLLSGRQAEGWTAGVDIVEPNRNRRGPSPSHRNIMARKRKEADSSATYNRHRSATLSPSQYRRDKCRSLPLDPEYTLYDSSSYGLTESERRMIDLSGYFGSNGEEEETGALSIEKMVI